FQSRFSLNVQHVAVAGEGALMALLDKRKKMLAAEGLFAPERKKPLPYLPGIIGVVTSLQGAVIRDILHRLRDRFPRKVLIWPVAVQGAACAPEVARAVAGFNALTPGGALPRPDLVIVARGGGSIEDLWGFNEEAVARAVAASDIPVISAVGHETDTTLVDFVADQRAPTPTAAAEIAVPVRAELLAWVKDQDARLVRGVAQSLDLRAQRLRDLSRGLKRPETVLEGPRQRLDLMSDRLANALLRGVQKRRVGFSETAGRLRPHLLRIVTSDREVRLNAVSARLAPGLDRAVRVKRENLLRISPRITAQLIDQKRERGQERLVALGRRLSDSGSHQLATWSSRLTALDRLRLSLGYVATLDRGFAVVRSGTEIVTSKAQADRVPALEIEFKDGRYKLGGAGGKKSTSVDKPEQGSLF
ncbi:MAG: exodeoxyribonuclease VII large subunit, partial [Rhodobacteraceae bacterium]|nr:exodeoxyribonuclease VII large subunit [Paracoccaceae bacterium]